MDTRPAHVDREPTRQSNGSAVSDLRVPAVSVASAEATLTPPQAPKVPDLTRHPHLPQNESEELLLEGMRTEPAVLEAIESLANDADPDVRARSADFFEALLDPLATDSKP